MSRNTTTKSKELANSLDTSNIWSGSKDVLCASLTFATELSFQKGNIQVHYPIYDLFENLFPDAEAAYQFYKNETPIDKRHILYMKIAKARFKQFPQLLYQIQNRGGYDWLVTCSHKIERPQLETKTNGVTKKVNNWWEGEGLESPFICCISEAYKRLSEELDFDELIPF